MELYLFAILVFIAITCLGGAIIAVRRKSGMANRLGGAPTYQAQHTNPVVDALSNLAARLATGKPSTHLREVLAQAGYHAANAASVYLGLKMILFFVGLALGLVGMWMVELPTTNRLAGAAAAGLLLFFVPNLVVSSRHRRRRQEVRSHLPDALDLLEVCVSAGMGTDMAWNAVADEIRRVSPVLADEMALANLEMHLGAHRAEAMRHMAQRTGEQDLDSLAAILVQSERLGTSISDALEAFATSMREARKHRAQEAAEAMAVKLLIPMIIFIFPAILIVLIGPAAMRISRTFTGW
jgi:tight adherence protein C